MALDKIVIAEFNVLNGLGERTVPIFAVSIPIPKESYDNATLRRKADLLIENARNTSRTSSEFRSTDLIRSYGYVLYYLVSPEKEDVKQAAQACLNGFKLTGKFEIVSYVNNGK